MQETRQISEFNESMFQIQRLHNHWLEFAKHIKRGNFNVARWELDDVESELYWDAKNLDDSSNNEKDGYVQQIKQLNKDLEDNFQKGLPKKIYYLLRMRERLLREIQQESGKGARYKSEDEDTML